MPEDIWSEIAVEKRAKDIAAALRRLAASARNEEELRIGATHLLSDFARETGLELDVHHEYAIGRGRADSIYGRVIIEFEPPNSLSDNNEATPNAHAIGQLMGYAEALRQEHHLDFSRMLGVTTDGNRIIFLRHRRGNWEESPAQEVNTASITLFLFCLKSLQGKALLPDNLAEDFGADPDKSAGRCVRALYQALEDSENPKVDALFAQWKMLFAEVCGYELGSPKLDVNLLAQSYGVFAKRPDAARLFFCIHSYYATLIKLLAAEIITFYSASYMPSYLGGLEALHPNKLGEELAKLEEGGIFGQMGVRNFLEGDFFAWYLEVWSYDIGSAIQSIVRALRVYDPATVRVDPEQTRDLLKKLYQYLLPKKLRHDLGEYYTPDWLAELVLDEIGYNGEVSKRILDPSCGSGTFPVLEIKRAQEWARDKFQNEKDTLDSILNNIVGFDLNPLAVITARTNYLIALGDLLRHRRGEIEIPIYLCDAVLTPSEQKQMFLGGRRFPLRTAVGVFEIPLSLGTRERIANIAGLLEQAVQGNYRTEEFLQRAKAEIGLSAEEFTESEDYLAKLYGKLCQVNEEGRNGIWARIIKNFFAPVFAGKFDYVAGNPPWINWESLPDKYRDDTKELWEYYGLFTLKGWRARMGGGKKDISALFLYVAADKYLKKHGRLGFLITESLFKSSGAGEGFRRFELPSENGKSRLPIKVLHVHDLVEIKPFEGAANRTAIISIEKGVPNKYPIKYTVWRKKPGHPIGEEQSLKEIQSRTKREKHIALPITSKRGSPLITGLAGALDAVQKAIGKSYYRAWEGSNTGGLSGAYWLRILEYLPDGNLLIENLYNVGKIKVKRIQARVESDHVYPLLRGRNIQPWLAKSEDFILMVQDPKTRAGYKESEMKAHWPLTYDYLIKFEEQLRKRSLFRKFFATKDPFYSMYGVGPQSFAEHKVVWREVATGLFPVVPPAKRDMKIPKLLISDHTVVEIAAQSHNEAHYLCASLASSPSRLVVQSYLHLHASPHILDHVKIPKFNSKLALHKRLAELSKKAHTLAAANELSQLALTEAQIDAAAAELWGITPAELATIQKALEKKKRSTKKTIEDDDL